MQKPPRHHHALTAPTATWPCPGRAAFPVPTLASAFPVNNVPAAAGGGRGHLAARGAGHPSCQHATAGSPGQALPDGLTSPQECHHEECRQLSHSGPLSLCEPCDGRLHGAMHFDGHTRFDLPPQGEPDRALAPLPPRLCRTGVPQGWEWWDAPGAGATQGWEWDAVGASTGLGELSQPSWVPDACLQAPFWPATCRHVHAPHAPALPLMWRRRRRVQQRAKGELLALKSLCAAPAPGIPVTLPSLCPQGAQELSAEAAQEEGLAQAHGRKAPAPLPGGLSRAAGWPWWEGGKDPWASSCHLPPGPQQGVLHLEV